MMEKVVTPQSLVSRAQELVRRKREGLTTAQMFFRA